MSRVKERHRSWMKLVAMVTVCLFAINSVSWACPGRIVPVHSNTLMVQSIFKPILDNVENEYKSQAGYELYTYINSILLKYKPFFRRNRELDESYGSAPDENGGIKERILNMTRDHIENGDSLVFELEIFRGPEKGKKFKVTLTCKDIDELFEDKSKVRIEEAGKPRQMGKKVQVTGIDRQLNIAAVEYLNGDQDELDLMPGGKAPIRKLKEDISAMLGQHMSPELAVMGILEMDEGLAEEVNEYKPLVDSILDIAQKRCPDLYTFSDSKLKENLFGFAWPEEDLIGLHEGLVHNPLAMFHEIFEYLVNIGRDSYKMGLLSLEWADEGEEKFIEVKTREPSATVFKELKKVKLSAKTMRFIKEEEKSGWPPDWKWSPHYLIRVLQREIFGSFDEDLTEMLDNISGADRKTPAHPLKSFEHKKPEVAYDPFPEVVIDGRTEAEYAARQHSPDVYSPEGADEMPLEERFYSRPVEETTYHRTMMSLGRGVPERVNTDVLKAVFDRAEYELESGRAHPKLSDEREKSFREFKEHVKDTVIPKIEYYLESAFGDALQGVLDPEGFKEYFSDDKNFNLWVDHALFSDYAADGHMFPIYQKRGKKRLPYDYRELFADYVVARYLVDVYLMVAGDEDERKSALDELVGKFRKFMQMQVGRLKLFDKIKGQYIYVHENEPHAITGIEKEEVKIDFSTAMYAWSSARGKNRYYCVIECKGEKYLLYRSASHNRWKRFEVALVPDFSEGSRVEDLEIDWYAKPNTEAYNDVNPALSDWLDRELHIDENGELKDDLKVKRIRDSGDLPLRRICLEMFILADDEGDILEERNGDVYKGRYEVDKRRYAHLPWRAYMDEQVKRAFGTESLKATTERITRAYKAKDAEFFPAPARSVERNEAEGSRVKMLLRYPGRDLRQVQHDEDTIDIELDIDESFNMSANVAAAIVEKEVIEKFYATFWGLVYGRHAASEPIRVRKVEHKDENIETTQIVFEQFSVPFARLISKVTKKEGGKIKKEPVKFEVLTPRSLGRRLQDLLDRDQDSTDDIGERIDDFVMCSGGSVSRPENIYGRFTGKGMGPALSSESEVEFWRAAYDECLSNIKDEKGNFKPGYYIDQRAWLVHDNRSQDYGGNFDYRIYLTPNAALVPETFQDLTKLLREAGIRFAIKTLKVDDENALLLRGRADRIVLYFYEPQAERALEIVSGYASKDRHRFHRDVVSFGQCLVPGVEGVRIAANTDTEMQKAVGSPRHTHNSVIAYIIHKVIVKIIKQDKEFLKQRLSRKYKNEVEEIIWLLQYYSTSKEDRIRKKFKVQSPVYEVLDPFVKDSFEELKAHAGTWGFYDQLTETYEKVLNEAGFDPSRVAFLKLKQEEPSGAQPVNLFDGLVRNDSSEDVGGKIAEFALNTDVDLFYAHDIYSWFTGKNEEGQIIFSEEEVQRWLSDFKDYLSSIRDEDGGWKEGYNHYYLSWLEFCHDSFELDYRIYFCVKAERIIATFQGLIECLKKAGVGFKMKTIDVENDLGQGKNLLPGRRKDHIILYFSEGDAPKVVEAIRSYVSSHKDDFYDWEAYFGKRIVPDVPGARIAGDPSDEMREACCASDPTYNSVIASIISAVVIKAIKRNKGILKEKLDKKHEEEVDSIIEAYFGKGEERRKLKEKLGIDEYYEAQSRFIRICFRELSDHFGEKEFHRLLTDIYKEHLAESGLDPSRVSFLRMMPEADPGDVEKKAQIGKRAKVESVDLEKGIAVARDSKGKERRIKLIPEDRLDIELFKDVICSTDKIKEERKQIINSILSLLEKSPPAFFTYDELVDDLFGFAWHEGRDKFVALHRLVADKKIMFFDWPVAMFHELAEYLIKAGRLKIKPENRMLIVSLDGQELPPILLSAETLQFIEKERKSEDGWPDGWEKNPHYLLRALQRELFGVLDETLTLRLKRIGGINSAVGLNDYLKVKDKGFELVGVNWHREIRKDLEELIGIGYLPWRPGVYAPTNDYKMAIHYAKNVARETEKLAERLKAKGRNDMRVLVIGAGTGIDALTAFHHARMNGISGVKVDAIDIDPMAVDNTLFSSELILGPDSNCIQPILVGEGKEFEGLDASYDLILFNAPNAIEVRPGQQIDTRAHMDKEVFKQIVEQICRRLSPEGMAIVDNIDTVFDDGRIKIGAVLDVEVMDAYEGGGTDEVKRVSFRLTPRKKEMSPMGGGMKPADLQERARKEGPKWSVGYLIRTGLFSQAKLIREVLSAAQKKEFSRVLLARAEAVYRAVASNRRNRIHARRSLALAYADLFWQLITGRARSKSGHEDETFSERKKALDRKWRSVERLFRQRKEQARRAGWFNAGFVRNAIIEEELEDWSDIARFIISLIPKGKKHNSLRNALEKAVSSVNEKGIAVDPRKELRKLKKEFKLSKDHAEILGLALGLGWGQGGGSSQEANRLHEICAHIRCAYEHRDKKDPRQLNRQILSMKDKYKEIKDLFLTEEGWYLHLEVKGQASFCKISMEGVFEPIEQELFLSRQLQVPDNSRYEVFDGTIEISGDPPVWSWKVYRELQEAGEQERIRNEIVDRILELRGSLKKMLEANASEDEMRPVVDELESLTDSLRPVRPRAAGREEKSIEKYSEFFLKVKEVAFKKIDDYTANAGLAGKLREVKNRWEDYEICVERPTWYRLATTLLGFFRSKVFIHIDLWEEILRQKDAAEILAEITARAILKDIEGRETDDNFELGRIFTNGRLKELEERVREGIGPGTAKIKEEMPANELRRIFNGLNVEERQVLAFMARRDPSALFAPLPDFSWRESELFFDRFNDVILVDGKYQYKGPEGVFKEVESEIRMRMANGSKRERYIKALGEIRKRLVFLAEYAETNFFKLGYLGFHEHDWELLAKLDIKLRNKILGDIRFHRDLRVNDSRVGQNIMFNLLSKLRQAGAVENFDDLYDLADDSRSEPIDLKIAIRSPHRIGFELPLHTGELSAVDFFDIAKKFNIHLQYMDAYNNGYSREMSRTRSDAMKCIMQGINNLPRALMWKLKKPIKIDVHFEPIPKELEGKVKPQVLIARYVHGNIFERVELTVLGFPTGEELRYTIYALMHEIMHKLSLSRSYTEEEIFPISDFHELCRLNGFNTYFEFDGPPEAMTISERQIEEITSVDEWNKLGYFNFARTRPDGSVVSYLLKDDMEEHPDIVTLLRDQGVEIAEDTDNNHIYAAPGEVVATIGAEEYRHFALRHKSMPAEDGSELLVSDEKYDKSLEILQRHLLRSSYPVAEREDGSKIYEIYTPEGDKGLRTDFIDEKGDIYPDLAAALSVALSSDRIVGGRGEGPAASPGEGFAIPEGSKKIEKYGKTLYITPKAQAGMKKLDDFARKRKGMGEIVGYGLTRKLDEDTTAVVDLIAPRENKVFFFNTKELTGPAHILSDMLYALGNLVLTLKDGEIALVGTEKGESAKAKDSRVEVIDNRGWEMIRRYVTKLTHENVMLKADKLKALLGEKGEIPLDTDWDIIASQSSATRTKRYIERVRKEAEKQSAEIKFTMHHHPQWENGLYKKRSLLDKQHLYKHLLLYSSGDLLAGKKEGIEWFEVRVVGMPEDMDSKIQTTSQYYNVEEEGKIIEPAEKIFDELLFLLAKEATPKKIYDIVRRLLKEFRHLSKKGYRLNTILAYLGRKEKLRKFNETEVAPLQDFVVESLFPAEMPVNEEIITILEQMTLKRLREEEKKLEETKRRVDKLLEEDRRRAASRSAETQRLTVKPAESAAEPIVVIPEGSKKIEKYGKTLYIAPKAQAGMKKLDDIVRGRDVQGEIFGFGLTKRIDENTTVVVDFIPPKKEKMFYSGGLLVDQFTSALLKAIEGSESLKLTLRDGEVALVSDQDDLSAELGDFGWSFVEEEISQLTPEVLPGDPKEMKSFLKKKGNISLNMDLDIIATRINTKVTRNYRRRVAEEAERQQAQVEFTMHYHPRLSNKALFGQLTEREKREFHKKTAAFSAKDLEAMEILGGGWFEIRMLGTPEAFDSPTEITSAYYSAGEEKRILAPAGEVLDELQYLDPEKATPEKLAELVRRLLKELDELDDNGYSATVVVTYFSDEKLAEELRGKEPENLKELVLQRIIASRGILQKDPRIALREMTPEYLRDKDHFVLRSIIDPKDVRTGRRLVEIINSTLSQEGPEENKHYEYLRLLFTGKSILEGYLKYLNEDGRAVKQRTEDLLRDAKADGFRWTQESFKELKDLIKLIPTTGNPNEDLFVDVSMDSPPGLKSFLLLHGYDNDLGMQLTGGCSNQCAICGVSSEKGAMRHMPFPLAYKIMKKTKEHLLILMKVVPYFNSDPMHYHDKVINANLADFINAAKSLEAEQVRVVTHGTEAFPPDVVEEMAREMDNFMSISFHLYHYPVMEYLRLKGLGKLSGEAERKRREAIVERYAKRFAPLVKGAMDLKKGFEVKFYPQRIPKIPQKDPKKKTQEDPVELLKSQGYVYGILDEMRSLEEEVWERTCNIAGENKLSGFLYSNERLREAGDTVCVKTPAMLSWIGDAAKFLKTCGVSDEEIKRVQKAQLDDRSEEARESGKGASIVTPNHSVMVAPEGYLRLQLREGYTKRFRTVGEMYENSSSKGFKRFMQFLKVIAGTDYSRFYYTSGDAWHLSDVSLADFDEETRELIIQGLLGFHPEKDQEELKDKMREHPERITVSSTGEEYLLFIHNLFISLDELKELAKAEDEKGLQKVYNAIKDVPFPIEMSFGVIHEGKKRGFRFRHKLIDESHPKYERDIFHSARYFDTQVKIFSPYDADAEGVQAESPTGEGKPKTGKPGKENEIKAYVKEKAEGTFETCNALMNPIEKALEGKTDPVDVVVDLSLIPKDDIENNAESWAYLVLLCRKLKNVNFRFELPDLKGKAKKREELQFDIGNMARKGDFEKALRRKIEEKKVFVSGGIDVDELFKTRINNPEERPDRIEIPIWNEEWLEWMKKAGESLKPYQYPVALKEFTTIKNKGVALRNLEAALVIGLAKASMVIARRVGAEELQGRKKSLLKKLNDLYKVIFDDKMPLLELEDLDSMIYNKGDDHGSRVRINDALTFALPPMVRMPLEALSEYQKLIHSYLRAA